MAAVLLPTVAVLAAAALAFVAAFTPAGTDEDGEV